MSSSLNKKPLEEKVVRLLQTLRKHPELYNPKDYGPRYQSTKRPVNQRTWDRIAKSCGFAKTEDAICRWRGLLIYFRHLLNDVASKKIRRGGPNTDNPDDKYVKLQDWRYYEHIKFMQPYIISSSKLSNENLRKIDCCEYIPLGNNIAPITIRSVSFNSETDPLDPLASCSSSTIPIARSNPASNKKSQMKRQIRIIKATNPDVGRDKSSAVGVSPGLNSYNYKSTKFENLSVSDQNLKSFFDAMFKSTQKLPKYHQSCIKEKLMNSIRNRLRK